MRFKDKLFSLKEDFWKEYKKNDGDIDLEMYEFDNHFKELLIHFFNNHADNNIRERIELFNIKNWTDINSFELLEDLLILRTKYEQLPSDLILECFEYIDSNQEEAAIELIREYTSDNDLKIDYFLEDYEQIKVILNKYNELPKELLTEFLDNLSN